MEVQEIIINALAHSLGADLHEEWRNTRKRPDGSYETRMKKSKDEAWTDAHGSDDVDIANLAFKDLPSNWQEENLEAARVAIKLVFEKVVTGEKISELDRRRIASDIHDAWLSRNSSWASAKQAVPFDQLSIEEQEKDLAQIDPAIEKVQDYIDGVLDIVEVCNEYNLPVNYKAK